MKTLKVTLLSLLTLSAVSACAPQSASNDVFKNYDYTVGAYDAQVDPYAAFKMHNVQ
jgi:hypothetical protein